MAESFGFYRSAMTRLGEKAEAVATLQGAQVGETSFAHHLFSPSVSRSQSTICQDRLGTITKRKHLKKAFHTHT